MAADSTGKVKSGDPFRAPPAVIWNGMIDAGQAFANSQLSSASPQATRSRATDLLKLKNSSGSVRRKGDILKIEGKVLDTVTDESIWLDGIDPTDNCRFGILKYPADVDEMVTAQVSGVCMAMVHLTEVTHDYAAAADGEYVLQSATSGPVEILFAPDGYGEQECVVRFVGVAGGLPIIMFQIVELLTLADDFCGIAVARAAVLSRPVGVSSVPGEGYDGRVIVRDMTMTHDAVGGCFFNEPPDQLIGRIGFAVYLESGVRSVCSIFDPKQWHCFSLCCLPEACGDYST
jgi:hypothetical protein